MSNDDSENDYDDGLYDAEKPEGRVEPAPQMLEDEGPDEGEERAREGAFGAGALSWNGKQLRPWTSAREAQWIEVRHSLGARHISECILSSYTFLPDAFRILFLCHAPQAQLEGLRGDPLKFQAAVDQWADDYVEIGQHEEATMMAMRIYNRAHQNHAESAPVDTPTHGDDLGN
jgi:hypothetical protein